MPIESLFTKIIPSSVVHYSRGEPFRSITDVGTEKVQDILEKLNDENAWGLPRFLDPSYLAQRFEVEERLRQKFIGIGGKPTLHNPIYFFLGRNSEFESYEINIGYSIDLKDVDPYSISFTYGDSMLCLIEENRILAGSKYSNPLCAEIYSVETLPRLFSNSSFPSVSPLHIEAQLWTKPKLEIVKKIDRLTLK